MNPILEGLSPEYVPTDKQLELFKKGCLGTMGGRDCVLWKNELLNGEPTDTKKEARIVVQNKRISVRKLSFIWFSRDAKTMDVDKVYAMCGNLRCINVAHLGGSTKLRKEKRRLQDESADSTRSLEIQRTNKRRKALTKDEVFEILDHLRDRKLELSTELTALLQDRKFRYKLLSGKAYGKYVLEYNTKIHDE